MFTHKIDDFKYIFPHAGHSSKATTSATAPPSRDSKSGDAPKDSSPHSKPIPR